jgi:hypothetical protein
MPIILVKEVNENSSCRIRFLIRDFDKVAIPSANIISAVLNVYDKITDASIGDTDRDVSSNFNDSTTLNFLYLVPYTDNAIVSTNTELSIETHVYKLVLSIDDGASGVLKDEKEFLVNVLKHRK